MQEIASAADLRIGQVPLRRVSLESKQVTNIHTMRDSVLEMYNVPGEGPVALARSLGLGVVDRLPFVKSFLMKNGIEV
jgi:hypothetical protein